MRRAMKRSANPGRTTKKPMPESLKAIQSRLKPEQRPKVLQIARAEATLDAKNRAYKFETPNGRAPYDREKEREINRRLSEELNKPKAKKPT